MHQCKSALHCSRLQPCHCGYCSGIHHGPYGVLFTFPLTIDHSCRIMDIYEKEFGYDMCDSEIAHEYNVALCLTTKELSEKWRAYLRIDK